MICKHCGVENIEKDTFFKNCYERFIKNKAIKTDIKQKSLDPSLTKFYKKIKIFLLLFIILLLSFIIFKGLFSNKQVDDKSEKIDELMIEKIRKTDRIVIKKYESDEIIENIDSNKSILLIINLIDSATLRNDLYEYIEPSYCIELYTGDIFIDSISLYPTLKEISFSNYNNTKRYDVNSEYMKKLYDFIIF